MLSLNCLLREELEEVPFLLMEVEAVALGPLLQEAALSVVADVVAVGLETSWLELLFLTLAQVLLPLPPSLLEETQ